MGSGYEIGCNECKTEGNQFNISIGGVMLLFCKEQLEELYKNKKSATDDKTIDNIVYQNIEDGFVFTENLGYLPYYCKHCKKLFTHFHFEMNKGNLKYEPEYICKICTNTLETAYPLFENDYENKRNINKNIKHFIYTENDIVKIKTSDNIEEQLICDNCGKNNFSIIGYLNID